MAGRTKKSDMVNAPDGTHGQNAALATQGRARAAGNLDVIRPGDPDHGKAAVARQAKGLRLDAEKGFRLSADDKPAEMIRVFDDDRVLFSGSRKDAEKVKKALADL